MWIKLFFEFDSNHRQVPLGSIDFGLFSLRSLQEIRPISLDVHKKSTETGNATPGKRRKFSIHHYGSTYQDGPETIPRWSLPRSTNWMDSGGTTEAVSILIVEQFEETILPFWDLGQFFRSTMEIWEFKVIKENGMVNEQWSTGNGRMFFLASSATSEDNGGKWDNNNGHRP